MSSKLILGTAQFGSNYGIKRDGQPSVEEIQKIARVAWDGGIRTVHTSWEYNFEYMDIFDDFNKIEKDVEHPELFRWGYDGVLPRIGMSAYNPNEILNIVSDIMVPVNVLDTRWLARKNQDYKLIARSVFLQGLLLMDELPQWLPLVVKMKILNFFVTCAKNGLRAYEAALGWVLGLDEIDHVIVGVNSATQLEQLFQVKPLKWEYDFSIQDENILDPRRWPKNVWT